MNIFFDPAPWLSSGLFIVHSWRSCASPVPILGQPRTWSTFSHWRLAYIFSNIMYNTQDIFSFGLTSFTQQNYCKAHPTTHPTVEHNSSVPLFKLSSIPLWIYPNLFIHSLVFIFNLNYSSLFMLCSCPNVPLCAPPPRHPQPPGSARAVVQVQEPTGVKLPREMLLWKTLGPNGMKISKVCSNPKSFSPVLLFKLRH